MKPVIVNIQTYGDFDMPSTVLVMIAPYGMTKQEVSTIVDHATVEFKSSDNVVTVKTYMQAQGFEVAPAYDLVIGIGL